MPLYLRDFRPEDKLAVDGVVSDAWAELASSIPGWDDLAARLGGLTANAAHIEVIVAELDGKIIGAVGYVGPYQPKPDFFAPEWPVVRLMSVLPEARGCGVGQALLDECVARARRDHAGLIALHTTLVMKAAQHIYRRAGFAIVRDLPPMYGTPFVLMARPLAGDLPQ